METQKDLNEKIRGVFTIGKIFTFRAIRTKLILTFVVIILVLEGACLYPLLSYKGPIEKYDNALDYVTKLSETKKVYDNMMYYLYRATNTFKIVDFSDNKLRDDTNSDLDKISNIISLLESKVTDDKTKSTLQSLKNMFIKYSQNCKDTVSKDESVPYEKRVEFYKSAKSLSEFMTAQIFEVTSAEMDYGKTLRSQLKSTTSRIVMITIVINLLVLVLSILAAFLIANGISKSINSITKVAGKIAKGDLTNPEVIIKSKDELNFLSNSFNQMVNNLKEMIKMVRSSSDRVLTTSEQLGISTNQSSSACEQIAASMQNVSTGATSQAEFSVEAANAIEKMYSISERIENKSSEVKCSSVKAYEISANGTKAIEDVINQIDLIYKTMQNSALESEELQRKSKEINKIVGVIKSITDQTNLLSLNASIEAARAGEHGKGFAVVADEIRKLADQTSDAAGKIAIIVKNIQEQSNKMSDSMRNGIAEINKGISITGKAEESFSNINYSISEVNNRILDIDNEIHGIREEIMKVKDFSKNIVNISSQSAENSEHVAASVEELTASMQEMQNTAQSLNYMANELKAMVDKFKM